MSIGLLSYSEQGIVLREAIEKLSQGDKRGGEAQFSQMDRPYNGIHLLVLKMEKLPIPIHIPAQREKPFLLEQIFLDARVILEEDLDSKEKEDSYFLGRVACQKTASLIEQGQYKTAIQTMDLYLSKFPENEDEMAAGACYLRGLARAMDNDFEGALQDYGKNMLYFCPYANAEKAILHYLNGNSEMAKKELESKPYPDSLDVSLGDGDRQAMAIMDFLEIPYGMENPCSQAIERIVDQHLKERQD